MNIFFLDWNPKKSAEYHCDKHVVKMIIEYAQLLCSSHHMSSNNPNIPYKLAHKNHPCSIWTRESIENYNYLTSLAMELSKEYTHRYNKQHKSQDVIQWCINNKPNLPNINLTEPPQAMPQQYKSNNVIQSYRNYYIYEKANFTTWKNRPTPQWFSK